jgi:hypothetical protein
MNPIFIVTPLCKQLTAIWPSGNWNRRTGQSQTRKASATKNGFIIALLAAVALAYLFPPSSFSHQSLILFEVFITGHRTNNFTY